MKKFCFIILWGLALCSLSSHGLSANFELPRDIGQGPFRYCQWSHTLIFCPNNLYLNTNDSVAITRDLIIQISGKLIAGNRVTINGSKNYRLSIDAAENIEFLNRAEINANVSAGGNFIAGNGLSLTGTAIIYGGAVVGNNATLSGNLNVTKSTQFGLRARVTGDIRGEGQISFGQNALIDGNVESFGNLNFGAGSSVNGLCSAANPTSYQSFCIKSLNDPQFCEDFESGFPSNWRRELRAQAGVNRMTANSGRQSLYLYGGNPTVTTHTIDLSQETSVVLTVWVRRGSDDFSEFPNSKEYLVIEYLDRNKQWIRAYTYEGGRTVEERGQGLRYLERLQLNDVSQLHSGFQVRFSTINSHTGDKVFDYWHIDDLCIKRASDTSPVFIPAPRLEYRFDELSWNGTANEVVDSSGHFRHARAEGLYGTTPNQDSVMCNAASFNGSNQYLTDAPLEQLRNTATLSFWIKTTESGNRVSNLAWASRGVTGIEKEQDVSDIFWGWINRQGRIGMTVGDENYSYSATPINDGQYHHVVLTRDKDSNHYSIYVDGKISETGRYPVTVYRGRVELFFNDIGRVRVVDTKEVDQSPRYLSAKIDEFIIFDKVLTPTQVQAIYQLQMQGRNLDGSLRVCEDQKIDHFDIDEYDSPNSDALVSNAINCQAEAVRIFARRADGTTITTFSNTVILEARAEGRLVGEWEFSGSKNSNFKVLSTGRAQIDFLPSDLGMLGSLGHLKLRVSEPANVNVNIMSGGISEQSGNATAGDDPNFNFAPSGFMVSSTPSGSTTGYVDMIGRSDSIPLYLKAISTDPTTGVCTPTFSGNVQVEMAAQCMNPTRCDLSHQVSVKQNRSNILRPTNQQAPLNWATVDTEFNENSTAPYSVNVSDLGVIAHHFRYRLNGSTSTAKETLQTSIYYFSRPNSIEIVSRKNSAGQELLPLNGHQVIAGKPIFVELEARDSKGSAYSAFNRIDYSLQSSVNPVRVNLSASLHYPSGGLNGAFSQGTIEASSGGRFQVPVAYYELEEIRLGGSVPDFWNGLVPINASYTINPVPVGKIVPAYLEVISKSQATWSSQTSSIYQGQPSSLTGLSYTLGARDADNNRLQNFDNLHNPLLGENRFGAKGNLLQKPAEAHPANPVWPDGVLSSDFSWDVQWLPDDSELKLNANFGSVTWGRGNLDYRDIPTAISEFRLPLSALVGNNGTQCVKESPSSPTCLSGPLNISLAGSGSVLSYARLAAPAQVSGSGKGAHIPVYLETLSGFDAQGEPEFGRNSHEDKLGMGPNELNGLQYSASGQCSLAACPNIGVLRDVTLANTVNGNATLTAGVGYLNYQPAAHSLGVPPYNGILETTLDIPHWLHWDWDNDGSVEPASTRILFGDFQGRAPILFTRPGSR